MKRNQRKRPLSQRRQAKIDTLKARHIVEPSTLEEHENQSFIWKLVAFAGALGVVAAALITGVWHR